MDHYCWKVIAGKKLVLKCFALLLGSGVWWQDLMLHPGRTFENGPKRTKNCSISFFISKFFFFFLRGGLACFLKGLVAYVQPSFWKARNGASAKCRFIVTSWKDKPLIDIVNQVQSNISKGLFLQHIHWLKKSIWYSWPVNSSVWTKSS